MEYAQRVCIPTILCASRTKSLNPYFNGTCSKRVYQEFFLYDKYYVLILVLMEHAQRARNFSAEEIAQVCLNPCFNGTCSKRSHETHTISQGNCLNPCFNGTCSKRLTYDTVRSLSPAVLILVLMEHAQRVKGAKTVERRSMSLNPCFNGTCSKSLVKRLDTVGRGRVLILVLMEHAQRGHFL